MRGLYWVLGVFFSLTTLAELVTGVLALWYIDQPGMIVQVVTAFVFVPFCAAVSVILI